MSEAIRSEEKEVLRTKKPYETPQLIIHGDVESITLGDDFGDSIDSAFTTDILGKRGRKKPHFS